MAVDAGDPTYGRKRRTKALRGWPLMRATLLTVVKWGTKGRKPSTARSFSKSLVVLMPVMPREPVHAGARLGSEDMKRDYASWACGGSFVSSHGTPASTPSGSADPP